MWNNMRLFIDWIKLEQAKNARERLSSTIARLQKTYDDMKANKEVKNWQGFQRKWLQPEVAKQKPKPVEQPAPGPKSKRPAGASGGAAQKKPRLTNLQASAATAQMGASALQLGTAQLGMSTLQPDPASLGAAGHGAAAFQCTAACPGTAGHRRTAPWHCTPG
jgi:hypothetical protein